MPTVLSKDVKHLSMRELSVEAQMKLPEFYALITSNIYKNPRPVALQMMLERAANRVKTDKIKDIQEIASECGFITPNYFIASFYHKYRQTPVEFRRG